MNDNETYLIEYLNTDGSVQSAHVVSMADRSSFPRVLVRVSNITVK